MFITSSCCFCICSPMNNKSFSSLLMVVSPRWVQYSERTGGSTLLLVDKHLLTNAIVRVVGWQDDTSTGRGTSSSHCKKCTNDRRASATSRWTNLNVLFDALLKMPWVTTFGNAHNTAAQWTRHRSGCLQLQTRFPHLKMRTSAWGHVVKDKWINSLTYNTCWWTLAARWILRNVHTSCAPRILCCLPAPSF